MAETICIDDTTGRDGFQTKGIGVDLPGRLAMAMGISSVGVDAIEIGMGVNKAEFEMLQQIAAVIGNKSYSPTGNIPIIFSLARALENDVNLAYESIKAAEPSRRGIHVFVGTSQQLRDYSIKKQKQQILEMVKSRVAQARELVGSQGVVKYSSEGATVTELDFLIATCQAAVNSGADIINVPDTTGFCSPKRYYNTIKALRNNIVGIENVVLSVHNHNDSGLAVATTLAGIEAGARRIEGCVLQLGERAGNVDWMSVVVDLMFMPEYSKRFDVSHIDTIKFYGLAELVSAVTGVPIPLNHPVVGLSAAAESSGIHVNGVLNKPSTYFEYPLECVGRELEIVIGQTSGINTVEHFLINYGYGGVGKTHTAEQLEQMTDAAKRHAIEVEDGLTSTETRLFAEQYIRGMPSQKRITLEDFELVDSMKGKRKIKALLKIDNEERVGVGIGEGSVDAYMNAMHNAFGIPEGSIELRVWKEAAKYHGLKAPGFGLLEKIPLSQEEKEMLKMDGSESVGQHALAKSLVEIKMDGDVFHGRGVDRDTTQASYLAITSAFDAAYRLGKLAIAPPASEA